MKEAVVELRTLGTTGGNKVWPAARVLLGHLLRAETDETLGRVLEVGSGTGWLGLSLALNRATCHVLLTEQALEEAQSLLRDNLEQNGALHTQCQVDVLDFFHEADCIRAVCDRHRWTLVIGSDLVYTAEIAEAFPRTVAIILSHQPGLEMMYCHTFRRYDHLDNLLLANFSKHQLRVEEVLDNGQRVPVMPVDESGGANFDDFDLFPEQRIAILNISRIF